jgi:exonuclease VII large subunit
VRPAQQNNHLQQQLQELKQQYEQTTKDMQQRITTLEQQIENRKQTQNKIKESTISAAELAAQDATKSAVTGNSNQMGAKYHGQVPVQPTTTTCRRPTTRLSGLPRQVGAFEFHGYLCSGYGSNSEGGQQVIIGYVRVIRRRFCNRSRRVLWLATASEKTGMLARLQTGDVSIPAGRVSSDHALLLGGSRCRGPSC